jgi:hypothetical protein
LHQLHELPEVNLPVVVVISCGEHLAHFRVVHGFALIYKQEIKQGGEYEIEREKE